MNGNQHFYQKTLTVIALLLVSLTQIVSTAAALSPPGSLPAVTFTAPYNGNDRLSPLCVYNK